MTCSTAWATTKQAIMLAGKLKVNYNPVNLYVLKQNDWPVAEVALQKTVWFKPAALAKT